MEAIVEEVVTDADLRKFENIYNEQVKKGPPSAKAQFEYAWCLVRSRYINDLKKGVALLEDLFHKATDDHAKRDYLFYLSVGYVRLKEWEKAKKFADAILQVEPQNHQAAELRAYIDKKMKKEGLIGMAIAGGAAAVVIGGIAAAVGVALSKK